jgi:hypothetical protein
MTEARLREIDYLIGTHMECKLNWRVIVIELFEEILKLRDEIELLRVEGDTK